MAHEAGANFIAVKGPELLSKYLGESERGVRAVFGRARASAPCVLFFDELDALAPRRGGGDAGEGGSGGGAAERVVNQLLTEMDGMEARDVVGVYVLGATNRPDRIDPALTRPGRLDKTLHVPLPSPEQRVSILEKLAKGFPLSPEIDLEGTAKGDVRCEGFSGADLAALLRESALLAVREVLGHCCEESVGFSSANAVGELVANLDAGISQPCIQPAHWNEALTRTRRSVSDRVAQAYGSYQAGRT